jgi:two-component system, OmpR family, sensor histidine kinase VicK
MALTSGRGGLRSQPWRLTIVAVVMLVLGLVAVGVIGLVVNDRIGRVVADAIAYDIELEEEADDLRAAVLDIEALHTLIALDDPSSLRAEQLDDHYAALLEEIGEMEDIGRVPPDAPQPAQLRDTVERYYAEFRPALDAFLAGDLEPAAFDEASDRGLAALGSLELDAVVLDRLGEALGEAAFVAIEDERQTGFLVLGGVIIGLSLVGALVGIGAVLMVREGRRLLTVADHAAQAKDDFIADASHELRTPLTVLRGNAEQALVLGTRSPPELFEDIASESQRMARVVDDLLLLATSDAAGLPLDVERLEAEPFLVEVAARAEALVEQQGTTLVVEALADTAIEADPTRIEQAIRILVDNAAKYGRKSPVRLRASVNDGSFLVSVRDEGPGIPRDAVPHIFERFYRTDRMRSRTSGGAGLGLAIAQSIVSAHGGRIQVDSEPERGTTMTIVLPVGGDRSGGVE